MVQLKDPILASVNATVQVFVIGVAGALMARLGVLDYAGANSLSRMTITLLLPCLEFTTLIEGLNDNNLDELGKVFLFCFRNAEIVHILLGTVIGFALGFVMRSGNNMTCMIACSLGFQNTTAVPLMFVTSLASSSVVKSDKDFGSKGTTYVLLYCVFIAFFKWTVAYKLLERRGEKKDARSSVSLMTIDEEKTEIVPIVPQSSGIWMTVWDYIKKSMNPPVYAVIVAVPLCFIPGVTKYVISGSGAVFTKNVYAAVKSIGQIASVVVTLILGQSLSHGYSKDADIRHIELCVTIIARLILLPCIGMAIFIPLYNHGFINRVMAFTMMNIYGCPTALQLLIISIQQKNQVENMSKLYFFVYCVAIVTMAVFTTLQLEILY